MQNFDSPKQEELKPENPHTQEGRTYDEQEHPDLFELINLSCELTVKEYLQYNTVEVGITGRSTPSVDMKTSITDTVLQILELEKDGAVLVQDEGIRLHIDERIAQLLDSSHKEEIAELEINEPNNNFISKYQQLGLRIFVMYAESKEVLGNAMGDFGNRDFFEHLEQLKFLLLSCRTVRQKGLEGFKNKIEKKKSALLTQRKELERSIEDMQQVPNNLRLKKKAIVVKDNLAKVERDLLLLEDYDVFFENSAEREQAFRESYTKYVYMLKEKIKEELP